MCDKILVLYIFLIIKILIYIIIPITLIFVRKRKIFKYILYVEIILLLIFAINNYIGRNACISNSSLSAIKQVRKTNKMKVISDESNLNYAITPSKKYQMYNKNNLYYYNQNSEGINNQYYECGNKKIYMNSIGSAFTSFSIAISSLYQKSIDPVTIFKYYKSDYNICDNGITIENIYNSTMKRYGNILLSEIGVNEVESSIKNDGIVIAKLQANENSKLTCDNNYIVIYNVGVDGKFQIADPSQFSKSYVCPYSSPAYGNIIDNDNMKKSWTLNEIDNEAIKYYLVKKG